MTMSSINKPRRRFVFWLTAAPVASLASSALVRAEQKPRLDPSSDRAQKLNYTHDADAVDNPDREPGARCENCTHFHGSDGESWNSCNIFPDSRVHAKGWCAAWRSA